MSNKQSRELVINLAQEFATHMSTRESAKQLIKRIEASPCEKVIIDFKDVEMVTRSFAHEYFVRKEALSKTLEERHMSPFVQQMFEIVKIPSPQPYKVKEKIHVLAWA